MSSMNLRGLQEDISKALVDTTRTAGQLASEDLVFHRSLNPSLSTSLKHQSNRLLALANDLTKVAISDTEIPPPKLSDVDSVDDEWRRIVDVLDNLLEKADASLDEYTGAIKRPSPSQEEQAKQAANVNAKQRPGKTSWLQDLAKPQLHFANAPANHGLSAFRPLLTRKPHTLTSLKDSLVLVESEDGSRQYKHPYEFEIQAARTQQSVSTRRRPIPYLPFDSTSAKFVDTLEEVYAMLDGLKDAEEIAIDLEHHDEHSYIGIVSLMQISTREKDWVIDTLKPWRQDLQVLNEVFTDPKILKVLHGSTMDIIWLQRDFGLYIVGLFDTYHATWALGYPKHSLAYLLKKFVDFDAAKHFQMADWRIRPLPQEMFNYARSDTHFLLYVYDMLRNELIDNSDLSMVGGDLVDIVMQDSKQEALQRYERPIYDEKNGSGQTGWYHMLYRTPALFNREQFAVFRAVHQWRDRVAREEDESINYVMPRKCLFSIARELPMDIPSLLGCSHPISKPVQRRKDDLLQIVRNARASSTSGPEMKDFFGLKNPSANGETATLDSIPAISHDKGLGPALAHLRSSEQLGIRATTSALWGPTVAEIKPLEQTQTRKRISSLSLVLPLPRLSAEVYADPKEPAADSQPKSTEGSDPGARAEHQSIKDRKSEGNEIFVLRDSANSRKRKASQTHDEPAELNGHATHRAEAGNTVSTCLNDGMHREEQETERKREKRERKLERKRLKQEKAVGGKGTEKAPGDVETEPFDYENAASVLYPSKADQWVKPATNSINPYAKSLDAPKGLRRVQKEIAGKSMTFKK